MKLEAPWSKEPYEIASSLGSNLEQGLSNKKVLELQKNFGKNTLQEKKKKNALMLFLRQFKNPMVYTLLGASLVAMILGEFLDAFAIFAILILNAVIGYVQENKANLALEALKKITIPKSRVLRGGEVHSISSVEIVPGDILHLEAGDYVSADARLVSSYQLTANESPLTGESLPVPKTTQILPENTLAADRSNMVHSGTAINSGSGKAIVTGTGMSTEVGSIAKLLDETEVEDTPLQKRLEGVTKKLIFIGILVIISVIVLRYYKGDPWFMIFMAAISLAVAAIPEGLPTVVTIALTLAVRRMTKRNAIVRNIGAVETLGSTDVICSDKTGTLTAGIMSVRETFLQMEERREKFIEAMVLCNNASIHDGGSGDTTEIALLNYAVREGYSVDAIRSRFSRVHEWSFDSDRKRMSVLVKGENSKKAFIKGAPESMLERSTLDRKEKEIVQEKIKQLSSLGYRLLVIAEKDGESISDETSAENQISFLGLVAMADPPKPETMPSIKECQDAGIKVVMITGDHPVTAKAIATELGIVIPGKFESVLTGKEVEELDHQVLRQKVEVTAVYARVSPSHKLKIIEALQDNDHIVAMTGDGVNDAPALRKAQIGVAMGKAGTEVARQAASIVLTDDNFSTIVSAVEEGRAIFGNIKRTIQYLLSTNLAELSIVLGATILNLPVPFTPIALLWINLVTDGLPSLALAAEPLEKNILKESGRPSPSSFFDFHFITELILTAVLMTALCLGTYYYQVHHMDEIKAKSMAFALLVFMALFRSFPSRSERRIYFELKFNVYHLISVILPVILHLWIQKIPFFQKIFDIVPLTLNEMMILLALALIPPTLLEVYKLIKRWILKTVQ